MIVKCAVWKSVLNLFLIIFYICILIIIFSCCSKSNNEQFLLKQVFVLSRHGLRTPLAKNLGEMTPKKWPEWKEKPGYLTQKGYLLEEFMGKYFSLWLNEEKLLLDLCPKKEDVFIYANVKQRTTESAKAFVNGAFPGCNLTIHQSNEDTDPIFNAMIHNSTSVFKKQALKQMYKLLRSLKLDQSLNDMSDILDYKLSELCLTKNECNLTTDINKIIDVQFGYKPNIKGPLKICNSAIDAFVMENYEGFSNNNVAWGLITESKWNDIVKISHGYHNVIFNTSLIAKDMSLPMVNYFKDKFLNDNETKFTLLMGHDANIYTILKSMSFKPYFLPDQHELTPISGKIVFQKWHNVEKDIDLLKISYIYQTTEQLRNSIELSMKDPPHFVTLELENCKTDNNGFCMWKDFVRFLESL